MSDIKVNRCRTCRFFKPGDWPTYEKRGVCERIHGTSYPTRQAQIVPAGNAWLAVDADFGCALQEPQP